MHKINSISITLIVVLLILLPQLAHTETAYIDSLQQELKGSKGEGRYEILHDLGWAFRNISTEKALSYEESAIQMAREWGDSLRIARSLYHLAWIISTIDYSQAVELAEKSIEIIKKIDESRTAKYYKNLGLIHEKRQKYSEAINVYEMAYEFALNYSKKEKVAQILSELFKASIEVNSFEKALDYVNLRLDIWEELKNIYEIGVCYNDFGRIFYYLSDHKESISNYYRSLELIEVLESQSDLNYAEEKMVSYLNISLIYHTLGNYTLFVKYTKMTIAIAEKLNRDEFIFLSYNLITSMLYYNNQYEKAYYYGVKTAEYSIDTLDFDVLGSCLFYLSFVSYYNGKIKDSQNYVLLARKLYSQIKDSWRLGSYHQNMGTHYDIREEYENSITHYLKAIEYHEKIKSDYRFCESYRNLAIAYAELDRFEEAYTYANYALIIAEKIDAVMITRDCYQVLSKYYETKADFEHSMSYLKQYELTNDSIFSSEKLAAISQMDVEIKALEKQKELDLLEQESDIITVELEKEKFNRIKLTALAAALILFSLTLFIYNRSIKRSNIRLTKEIRIRKSSEAELRKLKAGLEQQVIDRTAELRQVNKDLRDKIKEKRRSRKLLLETEKMAGIGELAAGIAHEIRNPIAIIKSTAQYLAENYPQTGDFMSDLTDNSDNINMTITRLMKFARLKSLELESVDITVFLSECLAKFTQQLERKKISMNIDKSDDNIKINIDPELFDEMLSNLISNSIEALPTAGEINIIIKQDADFLDIGIQDNGKGIKDIKRSLRSFYTTKKGHAGLGLNFVQYISGIHGFEFKLENLLNHGTRAKIILNRSS